MSDRLTVLALHRLLAFVPFLLIGAPAMAFTLQVDMSAQSPQLVGTPVMLTASIPDAVEGQEFVYKFEGTPIGGNFRLMRDFHTTNAHEWSILEEGFYLLRVTAIETGTEEMQQRVMAFARRPIATAFLPVVSNTRHPQVKLFSMRCPFGVSAMRVLFFPTAGTGPTQGTNFKPCSAGTSSNHYIAGLRGDTTYTMVSQFRVGANTVPGPAAQVAIGPSLIDDIFDNVVPAGAETSLAEPILLNQSLAFLRLDDDNWFVATDLSGEPVWSYGAGLTDNGITLTRAVPGGTFLAVVSEPDVAANQLIREFDLAGNVIRETTVYALNRHLRDMGAEEITSFHHEIIRLANGNTVLLASLEKILTDVQGPGDVNVYGEMVVALDRQWDPIWSWNSFDKLDPTDLAVLGEVCTQGGGGCPPLFLGEEANDWLHMNAIAYSPADGHLILSTRHQDAVYKIDYADGTGSGDLIWELGEHGDFTLLADPGIESPWFSHQHDSNYYGNTIVLYDNGNTRAAATEEDVVSRGQAYLLDEVNMTAELVVNVDLPEYSPALGSAQQLANGNYLFHSGLLGTPQEPEYAVYETMADGVITWDQTGTTRSYRSFRMRSLYGL